MKAHKSYGIYEKYVKRLLDIVLSLCAIIILSPVMLITAVLVRIKLGSPVIFFQERPGKKDKKTGEEKIFKMYKFRSMTDEKDENGKLLPDNVRLTSFGKRLRSTSLDELPELFNILKGDMSIVGPRPLAVAYLPYYTEEERRRHDVSAGLTGLAQVNGRTALDWSKRFEYDVEYVDNISFLMDLKIILKTIQKVLKKEDVVQAGQQGDFNVYREKQWKEQANRSMQ